LIEIFNYSICLVTLKYALPLLGAANVVLYPGDIISTVGENLSLSCTATGIPAPQMEWFKDGTALPTELFNITGEQFSNSSNYYTLSVLNLSDLQLSDSGEYNCTAFNTITEGTVIHTRSFMLEAQGEPQS
jgi:hypothetical protein